MSSDNLFLFGLMGFGVILITIVSVSTTIIPKSIEGRTRKYIVREIMRYNEKHPDHPMGLTFDK